jgi:hypothetical protein
MMWLQNGNWPISKGLAPFLASIGEPILPEIRKVFATSDYEWQWFIIEDLVRRLSPTVAMQLRPDLERLASSPTALEHDSGLDEVAGDALRGIAEWERQSQAVPDPRGVPRIRADFNGVFEDERILCLSHSDTCLDESEATVQLRTGMVVTAFDVDEDEQGNRDDLIATGIVAPSPDWLQCRGSRWVLMIDNYGVRHESDLLKQRFPEIDNGRQPERHRH